MSAGSRMKQMIFITPDIGDKTRDQLRRSCAEGVHEETLAPSRLCGLPFHASRSFFCSVDCAAQVVEPGSGRGTREPSAELR